LSFAKLPFVLFYQSGAYSDSFLVVYYFGAIEKAKKISASLYGFYFVHVKQQCKQNSVIIGLAWRRVPGNIYHSLYSFLFIYLPLKHFITSLDCTCIISQKKSFVKPFLQFFNP
jgi:hypothetical protein